jgi:tryptophanyl-tRNA synthetase
MNRAAVVYPPRTVAVIEPAATVHLGHYFGIIRRSIERQNQYPGRSFFILDDHALLTAGPLDRRRTLILGTACCLLALGIDTRKTVLFRRSDVPQVSELAAILSALPPEILGPGGAPRSAALHLLAWRATHVSVRPEHLGVVTSTQEFAARFNSAFKCETFPLPEPEALLSEPLPGPDGAPMDAARGNALDIFQTAEEFRSALGGLSPGAPLLACLRHLLPNGTTLTTGDQLAESLAQEFARARGRLADWQAHTVEVDEVLRRGGARAREFASETLDEVRTVLGL